MTLPDGTVVAYEYERRVAKKRNGEVVKRWLYDGQYRVSAEVDSTGAVTSRFVYGSQGHSPDYVVQGGVTYAYGKSHLGSIKLVVNAATGAVAQRLEYDAWGKVLADSSPGLQPFAFAGGVYDADTTLTHFGFRDYDPASGAWTAKDPIRAPELATLQASQLADWSVARTLNAYQYSSADPIRMLDSDGLAPKDKLFSLPKKFWSWYHRKMKKGGDLDLEKKEAEELFRQWKGEGCPGPDGKGKYQAPSAEDGLSGDDFLDFVVPFPVFRIDPSRLLKDWMPEVFGGPGLA